MELTVKQAGRRTDEQRTMCVDSGIWCMKWTSQVLDCAGLQATYYTLMLVLGSYLIEIMS